MKKSICLTFVLLFVCSCAMTKVTSFKDPVYAKSNYTKVAVFYDRDQLEGRQKVERAFTRMISEQGTTAIAMIDIIPPTRSFTQEEFKKEVVSNGCDCVLQIKFTGAYADTIQTGGSMFTTFSRRNAWSFYSPGETIVLPRVQRKAELIDVDSGKVVWTSDSLTAGNAYASVDVMNESFTSSVIKKLQEDGLITKKKE